MQTVTTSGAKLKEGLFAAFDGDRWKAVCRQFCEELGFRLEPGQRQDVDWQIRTSGSETLAGYAKCLNRRAQPIGIEEVQVLWRAMQQDGVPNGIFFSVDCFTSEAIQFANGREIELIDPEAFLAVMENLTPDSCERLRAIAEHIQIEAPVCLRCNLVMEQVREGRNIFWRCVNHPECACTYMW